MFQFHAQSLSSAIWPAICTHDVHCARVSVALATHASRRSRGSVGSAPPIDTYVEIHQARDGGGLRNSDVEVKTPMVSGLENSMDVHLGEHCFDHFWPSNMLFLPKRIAETSSENSGSDGSTTELTQKQPWSNVKTGKLIFQLKMTFSSQFLWFPIPDFMKV